MSKFEFGLAPARTREGSPRQRSEAQKRVDEIVAALVEAWQQAGEPSKSSEKPAYRERFETEEQYDLLQKMYRSAATLHGVSARFYDYETGEDGAYYLPVSAETKRAYKPRTPKTAGTGE